MTKRKNPTPTRPTTAELIGMIDAYETDRGHARAKAKELLMRYGHTSDTAEPFLDTAAGQVLLGEVAEHLRREEDLARKLRQAIGPRR
jgi:hypothetical protein